MQPQRYVQSDSLGWFHQMSVSNHLNLEVAVDTILGYEAYNVRYGGVGCAIGNSFYPQESRPTIACSRPRY